MYALKVMTVTEKHIIENLLFVFGFETRIKTISPLIWRLISEALLVADHVSLRCCMLQLIDVPHWFLINIFLRVGFSRCLCWYGFSELGCESERCIFTAIYCCSNSCCQMSVKLLHHTRAQEH